MSAPPALAAPCGDALRAARALSPPRGGARDGEAVLALLQRVADAALAWLPAVTWAGVVVALDDEPFTAVGTAVPGWEPVSTPWPGVAVPGRGAALLLSTPVLVAGWASGSVVLGGAGDLVDPELEVAEELARAVGLLLGAAVRRGRRQVADEIRFAVLPRPGR